MAYEDELKAIATTDSEDERLKLASSLAGQIGDAPDPDALKALEEQRDSLNKQLADAKEQYTALREKYVDAFFSNPGAKDGKPGDDNNGAPVGGDERKGLTLGGFLGRE